MGRTSSCRSYSEGAERRNLAHLPLNPASRLAGARSYGFALHAFLPRVFDAGQQDGFRVSVRQDHARVDSSAETLPALAHGPTGPGSSATACAVDLGCFW